MSGLWILPADVYDTLELSALAAGGIGGGQCWFERDEVPCCLAGHVEFCGLNYEERREMRAAFGQNVSLADINDPAVFRINFRKGAPRDATVSFAEWCAELNVKRRAALAAVEAT